MRAIWLFVFSIGLALYIYNSKETNSKIDTLLENQSTQGVFYENLGVENNNLFMKKCPTCQSGACISHTQNDQDNGLSWIVTCCIDSDSCIRVLEQWYPNINEAVDAWNRKIK